MTTTVWPIRMHKEGWLVCRYIGAATADPWKEVRTRLILGSGKFEFGIAHTNGGDPRSVHKLVSGVDGQSGKVDGIEKKVKTKGSIRNLGLGWAQS